MYFIYFNCIIAYPPKMEEPSITGANKKKLNKLDLLQNAQKKSNVTKHYKICKSKYR